MFFARNALGHAHCLVGDWQTTICFSRRIDRLYLRHRGQLPEASIHCRVFSDGRMLLLLTRRGKVFQAHRTVNEFPV